MQEHSDVIRTYRVVWRIDIEAPYAAEAARQALDIMRDAGSVAEVFEVTPFTGGRTWVVDLTTGHVTFADERAANERALNEPTTGHWQVVHDGTRQ